MLKNIRLHIDKDEERQAVLEQQFAQRISDIHKQNINAFQRYMPSVLPYIQNTQSQNIALFTNKKGEANIVDYGQGRTFYGLYPEQEISRQIAHFKSFPLKVSVSGKSAPVAEQNDTSQLNELSLFNSLKQRAPLPEKIDVLVVLGIGMGHHLVELLETHSIKHVILYEPEIQYFSCSVFLQDWKYLFLKSKANRTGLYLQLGKDGRDIIDDISELSQVADFDHFYCFQHYHHPIFDVVVKQLQLQTWEHLQQKGIVFSDGLNRNSYCPPWSPQSDILDYRDVDRNTGKLQDNLAAFKKYFPRIYEEFKDYKPVNWLPVQNSQGNYNLLNNSNLATWYGDDSESDCNLNFECFSEQPNKDGLVLGYTGQKLKHYLHYQFVKEAEEILDELEEETGVLPENIKSLIMFGLGAGYQLETLFARHKVEKLFICEPNRDFFYFSLFTISWADILQRIDESDSRLYINIGDDGSNLFRDLLSQFYAIGPYVLSQTYFYQSYYNSELVHAIAQLREQLQVVISMGEYFDHARYGIAHTKEGLERGIPHLIKDASRHLSYDNKDIPVMFVGNGPSLDYSIDAIKEHKDNAIIVSCGTSLQVLFKHGIVPDFHAEIEQNRSTFDWARRIDAPAFLKQITLISCNGIHPDTCELYKDVLVAFKEGESSTVSALNVVGEQNYEALKFAFPTVTNFAMNLFIKLGFNQMYLFGVDLGFADNNKHHSVQSGYYDANGKQLYDYGEKNNTSIEVPGNFRKSVFTKHEFKIAKMVLEQSIAQAKVECYNTSDGARIIGTVPLNVDDLLLTTTRERKQASLSALRNDCFVRLDSQTFHRKFERTFETSTLTNELNMFEKRLSQQVSSFDQAEALIESQKRMLFASYQHGKSLLFYYLYGTVNYANVLLNKALYAFEQESFDQKLFESARTLWLKHFRLIKQAIDEQKQDFDWSSALGMRRIIPCIQQSMGREKIVVVTNSQSFKEQIENQASWYGIERNITVVSHIGIESLPSTWFDESYVIWCVKDKFDPCSAHLEKVSDHALGVLILNNSKSCRADVESASTSDKVALLNAFDQLFSENLPYECQDAVNAQIALQHLNCAKLGFKVIYPKYTISEENQLINCVNQDAAKDLHCYDLGWSVGCSESRLNSDTIMPNGSRVGYLGYGLKLEYLIEEKIEQSQFLAMKSQLRDCHPHLLEDSNYV